MTCPYCGEAQNQVKAGTNHGSQRYKCTRCGRRYTGTPQVRGYPEELRRQAAVLAAQGMGFREISRRLGINAQTAANWVRHRHEAAADDDGRGAEPEAVAPPPTKRRPTIHDVAERASVSASTVSNYLNNKARMSEETRLRIQQAMEELHFTPSALVRALRQRRTRILGVLIFGMTGLDREVGQSLTPPILSGICAGADAAKHDILIYNGWPDDPQRHSGLDFLNGHVDGLLWVAPGLHVPALERTVAAGLPTVALLTRHLPTGAGYVNADNLGSMKTLVSHLMAQGHQRIAYAGALDTSNYLDRYEGYRRALAETGLPRDPALEATLATSVWNSTSDDPYLAVLKKWLALPAPPTAILMHNDGPAARMIDVIRQHGLSVPQEIAVTGFDDIPDARWMGGGLTTIRQPFRLIGQLAVERLLALIEGTPVEECRLTLPTELIVRASTDPRLAETLPQNRVPSAPG